MRFEISRFILKLKLFTYNYRLLSLRRSKGFTLKDLAMGSGIYIGRLSDIELLRDMPTEYEKDYIANYLGIDTNWLFPSGLVKLQYCQRELCLDTEDIKHLQLVKQLNQNLVGR